MLVTSAPTANLLGVHVTARMADLVLETRDVRLEALAPDWIIDGESVRRTDRDFWYLGGRHVLRASGREVTSWRQPMIFRAGGVVALVVDTSCHHVLVRTLVEAGNETKALSRGRTTRARVGPSLQFSRANLQRHGKFKRGEFGKDGEPTKPVPLASILDAGFPTKWAEVSEDPGIFAGKVNRVGLILVSTKSEITQFFREPGVQPEDYLWTSMEGFRWIRDQGWANDHLLKAAAMLL